MHTQKNLLPVRPEKRKHTQNDGQNQRQGQEDDQPEGYLLAEAGAPGRHPVTLDQGSPLNKALEPRPIAANETAIARPHHGQNRQTNRENRGKGGMDHHRKRCAHPKPAAGKSP